MTRRRFRLTVVAPVLVGLILAFTFGTVLFVGPRATGAATRMLLTDNGRGMVSVSTRLLFNDLYNLDVYALQRTVDGLVGEANVVHAAVRGIDGQMYAEGTAGWTPEEQVSQGLALQALTQNDITVREVEGYLVLSGPIAVGSEQIGTLTIAMDQSPVTAANLKLGQTMIPVTFVVPFCAIVLVSLLARWAATPFRTLARSADEIGRGNMHVSIPIRGLKESALLGVALERMRADLLRLYQNLEQQVTSLERRARYLEATAAVARDAASVLHPQELLARAATLISKQLGFYHTGIFLLDPTGDWLLLQAASSEGGRQMLARGHRLRVGPESVLGSVVDRGAPRITLDVGENATPFDNPDLPDTRSEVALPLRARGETIGALDVQSAAQEAFTQEDLAVLQTLADQVALAISNARLFQQAQEALEAERRAYGELGSKAWARTLQEQGAAGYTCDARGVVAGVQRTGATDALPALTLPVTARGQIVGTIEAHKSGEDAWTAGEVTVMETLADQVGIALESARLYEDTQRRAARERLTSQVTSRMRQTLDIDSVLQIAAEEIGKALDLAALDVRLVTEADPLEE